MTGTERQIAYATSEFMETAKSLKADEATCKEYLDTVNAGWLLDHGANWVSIILALTYIPRIPAYLATIPSEQHAAFFAECEKRFGDAKVDKNIWAKFEALKNA